MAILHSCCWWRSVRRGSFASAVYTFIYFGGSCVIITSFLHDERRYLSGEVDKPVGESFLEKEMISATSVIFNIMLLGCAIFGVIFSLLVVLALKFDKRELLIPWIVVMLADILVECMHFMYLIYLETLHFVPLTAVLFTIDFFITCLNVYCLLCVISQYQEYQVGRGGARHDIVSQASSIQYVPPTTTNMHCAINNAYSGSSCGGGGPGEGCVGSGTSMQRAVPVNVRTATICPHRNCTIIPEETNGNSNSVNSTHKSPFDRRNSSCKQAKKHVQFPDEIKCCSADAASIMYASPDVLSPVCPNGIAAPTITRPSSPPAYDADWNEQKRTFDDII